MKAPRQREGGRIDVSPGRVGFVYALLAWILGGSLLAAVTAHELWPFSPYPMYAWVEREHAMTRYALVGVAESGRELPVEVMRELAPFDEPRLYEALWRLRNANPP